MPLKIVRASDMVDLPYREGALSRLVLLLLDDIVIFVVIFFLIVIEATNK